MRYTRSHAARRIFGRNTLSTERFLVARYKSSAADVAGLFCAAALVALYSLGHSHQLAAQSGKLFLSLAITAAFATVAWLARGVNWSGALAGSAIAFVLAAADLRMFWELLLVFTLTFVATGAGKRRKQQLRTAERSSGRSASQVMANLGIAALVVAVAPFTWPVLAVAALAEAAADTCSSEIGMAFPGKTVLLTTWKPVAPGTDGGISLAGSLAAALAAIIVSVVASTMKLVPTHNAPAVVCAGFLGSLVDSLIGALLERRGVLSNDMVNVLGTAAAVAIARILL